MKHLGYIWDMDEEKKTKCAKEDETKEMKEQCLKISLP